MDQKIKKQWVEALRSGKYKQGRCVLRSTTDQYCCLGVLCEIQDASWIEGQDYYIIHDHVTDLPPELNPGISSFSRSALAQMNDRGVPFSKIATYIEENL